MCVKKSLYMVITVESGLVPLEAPRCPSGCGVISFVSLCSLVASNGLRNISVLQPLSNGMKKLLILILLIILIGIKCQPATTSNYYLTINGKNIKAELAVTEEERAQGLKYRNSLPVDSGMLFIYPDEIILSFWMKDTPLPLSIAFIKSNGTILDIKDMQPFSLDSINSSTPAQYALEMTQGWFQQNQIKVSDVVIFSPELKKYIK